MSSVPDHGLLFLCACEASLAHARYIAQRVSHALFGNERAGGCQKQVLNTNTVAIRLAILGITRVPHQKEILKVMSSPSIHT